VPSLGGKTIAITEARRAAELATLITKLGGVPYSAPAVREVLRRDQRPALDALDRMCRREVSAIIFLTGVGARAFLSLAVEAGKRDALLAALQEMFVAVRGPKPTAVLREAGVRIDLTPAEPTSAGLLNALARRGYDVVVIPALPRAVVVHLRAAQLRKCARGMGVVTSPERRRRSSTRRIGAGADVHPRRSAG